MCIRDRTNVITYPIEGFLLSASDEQPEAAARHVSQKPITEHDEVDPVSYTHLRAHETVLDLVCRLLLENKQHTHTHTTHNTHNTKHIYIQASEHKK